MIATPENASAVQHGVDPVVDISAFHKFTVGLLVLVPLGATMFAMFAAWRWTTYFSPKDFALFGAFYVMSALGITVGFHRMLTHAAFDAPPLVRGILLIFGMFALQGSPSSWAAAHIKHHAYSDQYDDPHSPLKGLFHAHLGWLFKTRVDKKKWARRQAKDPIVQFVNKTCGWWALLGILLPFAIGGWTGLLWGAGVRIFFVHHVTWSVNSICHTFGSRPFLTGERSTNNVIVGILGMGEGWHNNHHAFQRSAFHGMSSRQFDASGLFIRLLGAVGLASNIYRVPPALQEAKRQEAVNARLMERASRAA